MNFVSESTIQWKSLHLTHKKSQKAIIQQISGKISSGEFLAIMGPSGAGKTSFLSMLSCRINKSSLEYSFKGQISLNDSEYGIRQFSKFAGYIRQDDILIDSLTVQETIQFQAKLKLSSIDEQQRKQKVNKVIRQLNLEECRKTLVGGQFVKTISGGQRKRLCIALELISDPQCIVLDQPTSGLDSHNALNLIKIFQTLCKKQGKIIIATIHQPSSMMFQEMDKLLLLDQGKSIYFGNASGVVPYMKHLKINVDQRMNPADFFMLEISKYKAQKDSYKSPMNNQNFQKYKEKQSKQNGVLIEQRNNKMYENNGQGSYIIQETEKSFTKTFFNQFIALMGRGWKCYYRDITGVIGRAFMTFLVPAFMCLLFLRIGDNVPDISDQKSIENFFQQFGSYCFMTLFFNLTLNFYLTILIFPREKEVVYKETSSKLYSIGIFFVCKCIFQVIGSSLLSIIVANIIYFSAGFANEIDHVLIFTFLFILSGICGTIIGLLVGILISDGNLAIQSAPIIVLPMTAYGGVIANLLTLPDYSFWIQYTSPIRYCYAIIMIDQLSTEHFQNIWQYQFIRKLVGFGDQQTVLKNFVYLGALTILIFFLCIFFLYLRKKPI